MLSNKLEEPDYRHQAIALRLRLLKIGLIISFVWGSPILAAYWFGWAPLGPFQASLTVAVLGLNLTLYVILQRWPGSFWSVAWVFCVAIFGYTAAAQFLVPQDQLRMLLFYPAVGLFFLVLGGAGGWIAVVASLVIFAITLATGAVFISPMAVSTFAITLCVTSLFFYAFRTQAIHALDTIERQNAALDMAARLDPLTGLLNLRAFQDAMEAHLSGNSRAPFAIAFADVDHFKDINDQYGHADGDAALLAVANILREGLRPRDIVARIGGEEFAMLLPCSDLADALTIAERQRAMVESMRFEIAGQSLGVTISIGVAMSREPHEPVSALLRAADKALYAAKGEGRNRVVATPGGAVNESTPQADQVQSD
jgi:diguanylate cyclase (GGDEF)-like protein